VETDELDWQKYIRRISNEYTDEFKRKYTDSLAIGHRINDAWNGARDYGRHEI
jgi:hypothetical protein